MTVPEEVRGLGVPGPSALSRPYRLADVIRDAVRREAARGARRTLVVQAADGDAPAEVVLAYRADGRLGEATMAGYRWTLDYLEDIEEAGGAKGVAMVTEERPDGRVVVWTLTYDEYGRVVRATPTITADDVEGVEL